MKRAVLFVLVLCLLGAWLAVAAFHAVLDAVEGVR